MAETSSASSLHICVQNTVLVDVDGHIIRKYFTLNTVDCLSLKQSIFAYLLSAMYFQFLKALSVSGIFFMQIIF